VCIKTRTTTTRFALVKDLFEWQLKDLEGWVRVYGEGDSVGVGELYIKICYDAFRLNFNGSSGSFITAGVCMINP
jgi:hypothetical protein